MGERDIRVLIADDHAIVREGLRTILELAGDRICVVGEAASGRQAVARTRELAPDVVLMDVRMSDMDGVDATREILKANQGTRVIILTNYDDDDYLFESVRAGAAGYLLKDVSPDDLSDAIITVYGGHSLIQHSVLGKLLEQFTVLSEGQQTPGHHELYEDLTPREMQVLQAIAQGLSNREIAGKLVISEKTVKTHITSIFGKLDVKDRSQAMLYAIQKRLVEIPQ
ncbi:MAG: response regulator transcription factor [Chloroflexi bacterium]|nr:response regulator transcription factor [Chloroflexota bacterium]MBU1750655.1 response regulator transcription factor [Chloroflexota bacterium]